jgi:hypothetical protein
VSKISNAMSATKTAINDLRDLLTNARMGRADIAKQLANAESERAALLSAPLNRSDLESILIRDIQAQQAAALESDDLISDLAYVQSKAISNQMAGTAPSASPFVAGKYSQDVLNRLFFALGDPAEILKRLAPAISKIDFKSAGPSLTERRKLIATLDKTIAGLRDDLAEIEAVLSNADTSKVTGPAEPKTGERREMAPGEWATWRYMPGQQTGFWDWDSRPVVLRPAPNQPIQ